MRIITLISALVFLIFVASTSSAIDFSYGIKSGIVYSSFSGSHSALENLNNYNHRVRIGPLLGGFIKLSVDDMLALQTEMLITLKGENYLSKETNNKLQVSLYYIEFPLFFTVAYPLPTPVHIAPKIFTGPYLGLHMISGGDTEKIGIDAKPADFGFIIGIGVDVQKMLFEIQYCFGQTAISKSLKFVTKSIIVGVKLK